ncbi:hypothetical protein SAZ10_32645 [Mesorhizobium sp. BAC0120]|uniref:hypothetical protein n=1 Tax=Mesorhizobium sp. BAC0120 TaxID=3090670 RepID=UPI00298C22F9|nr:hypothetical protein [Mesorhizobium sp. BAC0120]MDW6026520.1 hypothetical protein [Mesorhizobium sp. BAC0120]
MSTREILCNLEMIKAEYDTVTTMNGDIGHYVKVQITSEGREFHFDLSLSEGELFAAELDVLASIIRARAIKTRLKGE